MAEFGRSTGCATWAGSSRLERAVGEKTQADPLDLSGEGCAEPGSIKPSWQCDEKELERGRALLRFLGFLLECQRQERCRGIAGL